jgi:hypothetical protein
MIDIRYTVRRIRTCYFNCTGIMELIVKFYHSFHNNGSDENAPAMSL